MGAAVQDVNELPNIERELKALAKTRLSVGFVNVDEKLNMIATVQEYGARIPVTPKVRAFFMARGYPLRADTTEIIIPERAPIRNSFDDPNMLKAVGEELQDAFADILEGKGTARQAATRVGNAAASVVRTKVKSSLPPKNHPMTLENKAGTTTLIASGELLRSVGWEEES